MRVFLNKFHKFLEDYDNRVIAEYGSLKILPYAENLKNLKEWYGFDVEVDEHGTAAWVEMSEENYTLFAIKYS